MQSKQQLGMEVKTLVKSESQIQIHVFVELRQ